MIYAKQFDYDLERMFADLRKKQELSSWPKANLKPLAPRKRKPVRAARSASAKPRRHEAAR